MAPRGPGSPAASRVLLTGLVAIGSWTAAVLGFEAMADQAWASLSSDPLGRPEDAAALAAAVAGIALTSWWGATALLTGLAALMPASWAGTAALRRYAAAVTPRVVRRAVGAGLGITLLAVGAPIPGAAASAPTVTVAAAQVPAVPAAPSPPSAQAAPSAPGAPLDPGWWPTSPSPFPWFVPLQGQGGPDTSSRVAGIGTPAPAVPSAGRRVPAQGARTVVVRPGDTLWALVARELGGSPPAARIAAEWPRWYAANRTEIGPDPDRLRPGQRLRIPGSPR